MQHCFEGEAQNIQHAVESYFRVYYRPFLLYCNPSDIMVIPSEDNRLSLEI